MGPSLGSTDVLLRGSLAAGTGAGVYSSGSQGESKTTPLPPRWRHSWPGGCKNSLVACSCWVPLLLAPAGRAGHMGRPGEGRAGPRGGGAGGHLRGLFARGAGTERGGRGRAH